MWPLFLPIPTVKVPQERAVKVGLRVFGRTAERLDIVGVLELIYRRRVSSSHR